MRILRLISLLVLIILMPGKAHSWGFWAHKRINRLAVFTLPPEMIRFYKKNIEFLSEHAVDPDKRRYAVEGEAQRHFIDVDHYGTYPFSNVPHRWRDAVSALTEDTLQEYGIIPWHIPVMVNRLTDAFKEKDILKILKTSADLGHYVGDSHVPLHTTENYNGQMTNQVGIHGFWESRLPELYGENYNYFVGKAVVLKDPLETAWSSVLESHLALDSVLRFEKWLNDSFPSDQKYGFENRNNVLTKVYSTYYSFVYHQMQVGQVERRMRTAVYRLGCFWYTAWVNAGQPDLDKLMLKNNDIEEEKFDRKLQIKDREAFNFIGPVLQEDLFVCCMHHSEMEALQIPKTNPNLSSGWFLAVKQAILNWISCLDSLV